MQYRMLGTTGVKVSELCLGAMTFGREADRKTSFEIMDNFVEAGGNFIDTANVYSSGTSEKIVGEWLKSRERDDMVIATKLRFPMGSGPNDTGLTRKHIIKALDDSLSRLDTDYVDLLQVHAWDPLTPLKETMRALTSVIEEGKVRYIGASNFRAWQMAMSIGVSREEGLEEFASIQPQYSLLSRATEFEIMPLCKSEKKSVLPWSPLKGGLLTGKYTRDNKNSEGENRVSTNIKRGWQPPWSRNENYVWGVVEAVKKVAGETAKSESQVSLNWLLSNETVTSPIIGARNLEQLHDNLGSTGWRLTSDQVDQLNSASEMYVTYPYDEDSEEQQHYGRIP